MRGAAVELSEAQLLGFYEWMLTGRTLEAGLREADDAPRPGWRYPGSGQEAAQVGFASALDPADVFAGGHRDLLARLVRGVTLEEALLELFGKAAGPSRGRRAWGVAALDKGVLGVSGSTADGVAVAVGTALAFSCRGEARVALACCGEGATATGTWHEAVNAAAVLGLPVVFAVQNNQYAYSLPNDRVSHLAYTAHRADGYGIPGIVVDGNDVLEVYAAAREAVERARAGEGPSLVEAVTFRQAGHHSGDPADYVDAESRRSWLGRDPLPRYEEYLGSRGLLDEARRAHLEERVRSRVGRTIDWARRQADPVAPEGEAMVVTPHPAVASVDPEGPPATFREALAGVLEAEMSRDPAVVVLGPDVGRLGGPFGVTRGLQERYGAHRVIDFPTAGPGLVGAAVGAAAAGLRPVAEIPARHLSACLGLLAGHAAEVPYPLPLVLRVPCGASEPADWDRVDAAALGRHPGIKVVAPATAAAAAGLLAAAMRDPGPVVLLEPVRLYGVVGPVPAAEPSASLTEARLARPGDDVTVAAWGPAVHSALAAAEEAAAVGVSVEVIDLQALGSPDWGRLLASVERTGRLVVVEDGLDLGGLGAEVAARAAQEGFWHLDAPVRRVAPARWAAGDDASGPRPADILSAVLSVMRT